MGSGSLAAMAVFEAQWKPNMTVCGIVSRQKFRLTRKKERGSPRSRQRRDLGRYLQ